MVTHSTKAASHAGRVLFIKDGELFHQIYRGNHTNEQQYQRISDTLTLLGEQAVMFMNRGFFPKLAATTSAKTERFISLTL